MATTRPAFHEEFSRTRSPPNFFLAFKITDASFHISYFSKAKAYFQSYLLLLVKPSAIGVSLIVNINTYLAMIPPWVS